MAANLIQALFESKKGADVVFVVDGEDVSGHRAVLSLSCPYFDTMLFGATNEAKMSKIELKGTPLKQFKEIIRYCYLREIKIEHWSDEEVVKMLMLAHEYQLNELVHLIESELREKRVNINNLDLVFNVAALLDQGQLVENCLTMAERNADEAVEANNLMTYSGALLSALMERHTFKEHKQDEILAGIAHWKACHNSDELKWVLKKINWQKVSRNLVIELMRELVDKTDCSELRFWDTITEWTRAAHSEASSSPLTGAEALAAQIMASLDCNAPTSSNNNQAISPPPSLKRPPSWTLSASNPGTLNQAQNHDGGDVLDGSTLKTYTVGDLVLRSGIEHRFACDLGAFQIWLTGIDVRIVFSEQNVYIWSISFEVDSSVSPTIKNVQCNGKHCKTIPSSASLTKDSFVFNVDAKWVNAGRCTQIIFSPMRSEITFWSFKMRAGKALSVWG